jgi:putative aldouronate transport system substrate-binding protein
VPSTVPLMDGCSVISSMLISGTQPDDVWEKTKALNESAKVSTLYGFSFNVDSIKAESANSAAIVNEYRAAFNTGMFGDDTEKKYNEFLAKLKTAGIDKVLAEKQKQVDAFIASKK